MLDKIATIQKNLDKSASFFSGKICKTLGLRYAPEIRFYHDDSKDLVEKSLDQYKIIDHFSGDLGDVLEIRQNLRQIEEFTRLTKVEMEEYLFKDINDTETADKFRKLYNDK